MSLSGGIALLENASRLRHATLVVNKLEIGIVASRDIARARCLWDTKRFPALRARSILDDRSERVARADLVISLERRKGPRACPLTGASGQVRQVRAIKTIGLDIREMQPPSLYIFISEGEKRQVLRGTPCFRCWGGNGFIHRKSNRARRVSNVA